ncbi:MAG: hypothetical protein NZ610_03850 [Candidatus Bipolaricaulota bacterium]|nr:hypothetical protein [Candidatus Bipolaricaulota bacterium]
MFRRLLTLIAVLAVACTGWSWTAHAAPVSGSALVEIVFIPLTVVDAVGQLKLDRVLVKFEADLILTLSVSGIDITSTSAFTFKGLEFQSFVASGTVGPAAFRVQMIFAPNIVELRQFRDAFGRARYCVDSSNPPLTPYVPLCPSAANLSGLSLLLRYTPIYSTLHMYGLLNGFYHSAVENLVLANLFDTAGHLDPALTFRKKVVDLTLNIAGLVLGLRGMFANIGGPLPTSNPPANWRMAVVTFAEGQTVSGIAIRAETWIGARQGAECFGECKPLERVFSGMVEDQFIIYEEKIIVRNVRIAGVTWGARLEFWFAPIETGDTLNQTGLNFIQLTQAFTLAPFGLSISNVMNIGKVGAVSLQLRSNNLTTSLRVGDMAVTATLVYRPASTGGAMTVFFSQIVVDFDPPGMKWRSILTPCVDETTCPGAGAVAGWLGHDIFLTATVGDVDISIWLGFIQLMRDFYGGAIDVSWKIGNLTVKSSTVLHPDSLAAQRISLEMKF